MKVVAVAVLGLLNFGSALQVLLPSSGNNWDLDRLDSYPIVWSSVKYVPDSQILVLGG